MALLKRVFLLFFVFILFFDETAVAARSFLLANKKGRRAIGFSLDFGASMNFHYNREVTILTAPDFNLNEAHLTVWYQNAIGFYGIYGASLGTISSSPRFMGGGVKLALVNFVGKKSGLINGISVRLLGDFVSYTFPPDPGTQIYDLTGTAIRYGGAIEWGLFSSSIYLDTAFMMTRYSDNFFVCPFVGLGVQF